MRAFQKSELKNGIRVVTEEHPGSRAVSVGVWVLTGTRDESLDQAGISHLLEHMVFKGTKTRSAYQIAKSLEALGGELNAYTTREYTCYHALVLKDHWQKALEVLSDLVTNMQVSLNDFKREKGVILQEIGMSDESHEEVIYDIFFDRVYGKHPLGRPILGTIPSIVGMTLPQVKSYYRKAYTGKNIIVSMTGPVDHDEFMVEVKNKLGKKPQAQVRHQRKKPGWKSGLHLVEKTSEQIHMLLGFPAASFKDKYRFEALIVNTLLGGGMTSRLYQAVREKKGLVYSIYSSLNTNIDSGMIMIYASSEDKNIKNVGEVIWRELKKLKAKGISASEVEMYKTQIIGSILLGADDVENRMNSLAVNEMIFGRYRPVEDIVSEIQKITQQSVNRYIREELKLDMMAGVLLGAEVNKHAKWWNKLGV